MSMQGRDSRRIANSRPPATTSRAAIPVRQRWRVTVASASLFVVLFAAVGFVIPAYALALDANDQIIGGTSALALLMALAYWPFATGLSRWTIPFAGMAAMIAIYVLLTAYHADLGGLKAIIQITLAFSCLFVGLIGGEALKRSPALERALLISLIACYLSLVLLVQVIPLDSDDVRKNAVGGASAYVSILIATMRHARTGKFKSLLLAFPLMGLAAFLSDHRIMVGAAPLAIVALMVMWTFRLSLVQRSLVLIVSIASALSVYMYAEFRLISGFMDWNIAVAELTGRSITSGRQLIWGPVYAAIGEHPWLGNGFALTASDLTGLEFSAHNAFLMVALQTGVVGLAALIGVIWSLAVFATRGAFSLWKAYFVLVLSIAILHSTFETVLFQVNFSIATLIWLSLGIVGSSIPREGQGVTHAPSPIHSARNPKRLALSRAGGGRLA